MAFLFVLVMFFPKIELIIEIVAYEINKSCLKLHFRNKISEKALTNGGKCGIIFPKR